MTVFAGVDAGGSFTEAAIADGTATPRRHRDKPAVLDAESVNEVASVIERSIRNAQSQIDNTPIEVLVVGIAGAGDPQLRQDLRGRLLTLGLASSIHVVADAELQLEAALSNAPGIVVVGGTGSIALARDANGTVHRSGGHGFRFSDEGGGYDIGRAAIQAVLKAADGRGRPTILTELLYAETGAHDEHEFAMWTRKATRQSVAALASVVMLADQAKDVVARRICKKAAKDLAALVTALTGVMSGEKLVTVALAGGLLNHETPLRRRTMRAIEAKVTNLEWCLESIDPVDGALAIARRLTQ